MDKLEQIVTYYPKEHFWSPKRIKSRHTVNTKKERHGMFIKYDYNNPEYVTYQAEFKNGKRQKETFFYPNGKVEATINHHNGVIQSFDQQGNLRYNGDKKKAVCYDGKGNIIQIL